MSEASTTFSSRLTCRFVDSLLCVSAEEWNGLCGLDYPFLRHEFLAALEITRCCCRDSGWQPHHLLLEDGDGNLQGCMPLYLKDNSYGEYVFDWSWADAYYRHGLEYYPKLISAIPFTPAMGPRLCLAEGIDRAQTLSRIADALREECTRLGASGWHLLFPEEEDSRLLADMNAKQRLGCQYHWFNHGYDSFDALLASFNSRKRKNIRKERQKVKDAGIRFRQVPGQEISKDEWHQFYQFYQSTYLIRGRSPYLNRAFFLKLADTMPEQILLVLAYLDEECIAGALSFIGSDTLYGRYWGSVEDYQFLHFETCYYQGIDYCIEKGLKRFDSGAQGEHKIQRGFEPVSTWSNHWLRHPQFHAAIESFLEEEERHMEHYMQHAGEYLPFRKT